jgi:hypothetical protein
VKAVARASRARRRRLLVWRVLGHGVAFYRAAVGLGVWARGSARPGKAETWSDSDAGGRERPGRAGPACQRERGREGEKLAHGWAFGPGRRRAQAATELGAREGRRKQEG